MNMFFCEIWLGFVVGFFIRELTCRMPNELLIVIFVPLFLVYVVVRNVFEWAFPQMSYRPLLTRGMFFGFISVYVIQWLFLTNKFL